MFFLVNCDRMFIYCDISLCNQTRTEFLAAIGMENIESSEEHVIPNKKVNAPIFLLVTLWTLLWYSIPIIRYLKASFSFNVTHFKIFAIIFSILHVLIGLIVIKKYYKKRMVIFSVQGWPLALVLLVGLITIQTALTIQRLNTGHEWWKYLINWLYYLVFIGFAEELWFRGIWFAIFKNRFIKCVILGSIFFGLIHLAPGQGIVQIVLTGFIGFAFAIARYCGTSIFLLALVHGMVDFLNNTVLPVKSLRVSPNKILFIFILGIFITTLIMYYVKKYLISEKPVE